MATLKAQSFELEFLYHDLDSCNDGIEYSLDIKWEGKPFFKPSYIDTTGIQAFLNTIKFPAYFLDFETYQTCLPLYDGMKPYQQIPFQYSLHILKNKGDEKPEHKEFLANENKNEWRTLAEQLVTDIPSDEGSVIVFNASFEKTRNKEMATAFPDLAERLLNIIPDTVTEIGEYAFRYCKGLASVTIPASVTEIGYRAFSYCKSLTSITVHPDNPVYSSESGVLFNKEKTELIIYPAGRKGDYTIPDSIKKIERDVFRRGCIGLTSIV